MNRSPHILVILGSTRQGRNADTVVRWLMSRLHARFDAGFELVDLRDLALPFFDNAIDHLYHEWGHKPAAIVSYGGSAGGYRAAEQLRQVLVELKMVPVREQVGVPAIWAAFDEAGKPQDTGLDRAVDAMTTELLWWATALIPARERDRETLAAGAVA